jgi:endonuclease/exonuclease/phosphatase family metal-dependent hydrolase
MVYGVHLKSNRSSTPDEELLNYTIRNESVDQLIAHMARMETQFADRGIDGWIVAGDFNTNHDGTFGDRVITTLEANGFWNSWVNTPPAQRPTWKGRGPFGPGTLDYIMTRGFGLPDAQLIELPSSVSDHNAVIADLTLPSSVDTPEPHPE